MKKLQLLRKVLVKATNISQLDNTEWNELLRQCYATRLTGRLCACLVEQELEHFIPSPIRWHFTSAMQFSIAHKKDVAIEVEHIERALRMGGIQPVFLKGVAYQLAGDAAADGRVFSDIDFFVEREQLESAEQILNWNGWRRDEITEYDESYYRRWMHEIPAMTHLQRGSTIDVHHSLLPLTGRLIINSEKLQSRLQTDARYLVPVDRIIHSAAHLLMESEFDKGLRDLSDLDCLLRQHSQGDQNFWDELCGRANELEVGRLLFYALRYCQGLLETPVPERVLLAMAPYSPSKLQLRVLDWLFEYVLTTPPEFDSGMTNRIAHFLMFIRGHWLRMPMRLLVPHLFHKAFISPFQNWKKNRLKQDSLR